MKQTELTKLSQEELDANSGAGFLAIAAVAVPIISSIVTTGAQVYKTITSNSGSIKTKDSEFKWEEDSKSSAGKTGKQTPTTYYVY